MDVMYITVYIYDVDNFFCEMMIRERERSTHTISENTHTGEIFLFLHEAFLSLRYFKFSK